MDGNSRNQNNYEDENFIEIKKITYWDIYGVKRFPYRGRRKYTPLLYQSVDGGMIISNDVFGLTIRQFEHMYRACLDRRKTQEQWILNLRYPDKSSNDYLEYLENCTDCVKDRLPWLGNDPREKYLYEHIVQTVGTELDIRNRQRLFIIQDMIDNECTCCQTQLSSGSLAEGLDLPGSDIDIMCLINHVDVIQKVRNIKHPIHRTTLVMERDIDHPGFTRLKLVAEKDGESIPYACFRGTGTSLYVSVNCFLDCYKQCYPNVPVFSHGPCLSDQRQNIDIAFCLRSKYFPYNAIPWASRHRWQWPPNFIIDKIINSGCLLVPIGPKNVSDSDLLWRLSFSVAEKILVHSFNFTQLLCYGLLKLALKRIVNRNNDVKELLCSYFLKTALFWISEEEDINTFQLHKLCYCFSLCLDKLISWVNISYCPNYFIPEHNMFLGKINQSNNKMLLRVLESIKFGGIDGLIKNLFPLDNENHRLSTKSQSALYMLDILFYRITGAIMLPPDILRCYKGLALTESLIKSESSTFIIDVCKYYHANISQCVSQLLPPPNTIGNRYKIRKCYNKHLQDGIKTDAVSGWLFYASFYYVTGQYKITLRLTDYVLTKCTPDMLYAGCINYCEKRINIYRRNVHSTMTLNDKMKIAIVACVGYFHDSTLLPEELPLELEDIHIIPPVVLSHCLRFLCYHQLGDIFNRQQALRALYYTVKELYFIPLHSLSEALTILGICYEISEDKDMAYQCYHEAHQRNYKICPTSEVRRLKLLDV